MTTITVHSFKGGTGKSLISSSLAYFYSKRGTKVLLIDGDFSAPCLDSYFPPRKKISYTFVNYLKGSCSLEKTIYKTDIPNLSISYAPTPDFSEEVLKADSATHGRYLKKMLEAVKEAKNKLGFDKIIFDNSNGISLNSINQLAVSNQSIIVIRPSRYGIEPTYTLINTIYSKLTSLTASSFRKDFLIWNQVPFSQENIKRINNYLQKWITKFKKLKIEHATTIPLSIKITSEMITDTFNFPKIAGLMEPYIQQLQYKLDEG